MTELTREGKHTVRIGDAVSVKGWDVPEQTNARGWARPAGSVRGWTGGRVLAFLVRDDGEVFAQVSAKPGFPGSRWVPADVITRRKG